MIRSKKIICSPLILFYSRVKAMENELQAKTKVDRGLLNAWFIEVQRSKVRRLIEIKI